MPNGGYAIPFGERKITRLNNWNTKKCGNQD